MSSAIVIGGGISGIAAATRLRARGFTPMILESSDTLGGRVGTRRQGEVEVELGGRNFSPEDRALVAILEAYGVSRLSEYTFNSSNAGDGWHVDMRRGGSRFIRAKRFLNNLIAVEPLGLRRLRMLAADARKERAGTIGTPFWVKLAEETSDCSAGMYFGRRLSDEVVRPWTLRMMGSEPEEVFVGNLGPFLGRPIAGMRRLEGGWGQLWRAVQSTLDVRLEHRVTRLVTKQGRVVGVEGFHGDAPFSERANLVVVTTPAVNAADLLGDHASLAGALRQVIYRPLATIVAEYTSVEFPGGVGGLFLPKLHASSHIAKYDDKNRVRYSFAGVAARRLFDADDIGTLVAAAESSFASFGGRLGKRLSEVGTIWRPGLCGHSWMHHRTVERIRTECDKVPGLALAGDYFRGTLLESCTIAANENVDRALDGARRSS